MTSKHAAITCFGRATARRAIEPASIAPDAALDTPASRFPVADFRHYMETRQLDKVTELFTDDFVARPLGTDKIEFRGPAKAKAMWNAVLEAGQFTYTEQFQSY